MFTFSKNPFLQFKKSVYLINIHQKESEITKKIQTKKDTFHKTGFSNLQLSKRCKLPMCLDCRTERRERKKLLSPFLSSEDKVDP
jgi:hypothetical protein